MQELLEKLKSLDPTIWEKIARGLPMQPCGQYLAFDNGKITTCQYREAYMPFGSLSPEVACAWLQACLQDAISLKGWFFYIQWDTHYGWMASINDQEEPCAGDSPAKSLLAAYIAACEAKT